MLGLKKGTLFYLYWCFIIIDMAYILLIIIIKKIIMRWWGNLINCNYHIKITLINNNYNPCDVENHNYDNIHNNWREICIKMAAQIFSTAVKRRNELWSLTILCLIINYVIKHNIKQWLCLLMIELGFFCTKILTQINLIDNKSMKKFCKLTKISEKI